MGIPCLRTLILLFMEYLPSLIWFFLSWFIASQLKSPDATLILCKTSVVLQMPRFLVSLMSWGSIWGWGSKANVLWELWQFPKYDGGASYRVAWWSKWVRESTQIPKTKDRPEGHLDQCFFPQADRWGQMGKVEGSVQQLTPPPPQQIFGDGLEWNVWDF